MLSIVYLYFIAINAAAFASMGIDKSKAKRGAYRISEKTLWLLAAAGGTPGSLAGMYLFRHKTKHASFTGGMPLLLFVHAVLIVWVINR
ncbi:DUF1294 domain-containing protein [Bacillus sp. M6-12]|uniref:DUF1294 domain-containing protein n=1 Tax=Bacillus sp. M6-12 TaxID=2054166 RepID=UPI000C77AC10|nr:DUF1294 domain-containing protein [Bacillus sp. M6-12]PLS16943.1 DUF1294 domain-containing protein [Bacillus sp. M6-12]